MSADSFHHVIEQGMRKKRIEDFQDSVDLVDYSGKALVMEHDDFLQIPRARNQETKAGSHSSRSIWKRK